MALLGLIYRENRLILLPSYRPEGPSHSASYRALYQVRKYGHSRVYLPLLTKSRPRLIRRNYYTYGRLDRYLKTGRIPNEPVPLVSRRSRLVPLVPTGHKVVRNLIQRLPR